MQVFNSNSNIFSEVDTNTIQKFIPYIRFKASKYNISGIETDDLIQEGLIALLRAVSSYSEERNASFKTYATKCIDNGIFAFLKKSLSNKNIPLNDYVSLEFHDFDIVSNEYIEDAMETRVELERVFERMNSELSLLERKVLSLFVCGYSYKEVAAILVETEKTVENAILRARKKLKI